MTIQFQCQCGKLMKTADESAGKRGKCPACGAVITIPEPAAPAPAAPSRKPPVRRQPGGPRPPVAVEAAAGPGQQAPGAACRAISSQPTRNGHTFCFQGVEPNLVASRLGDFFRSQGYRLESGSSTYGTYGRGSDLLRILFGAFARRYKFKFDIRSQEPNVWLTVNKGMSGAMGGLIGYASMNREVKRILQGLRARFG